MDSGGTAHNSAKHDARSFVKADVNQTFHKTKYSLHPAPEPNNKMSHSQPPVRGGVLCADVMRNVRAASNEYQGKAAGIFLREKAREKSVDRSPDHQTGSELQLKID